MTQATTGFGTSLQLSDGTNTATTVYTAVAEVTKFTDVGITRDTVEATTLTSPGETKEFIPGLNQSKSFGVEVNYLPLDSSQKDLLTNLSAATPFRTWRIVLPDFGALTETVSAVDTTAHTLTTAASGWLTGQAVKVTSTGTVPAPLVAGGIYYARMLSATVFALYNTPSDAAADVNRIAITTAGSGTVSVLGTSHWTFTAMCADFNFSSEPGAVLRGSVKFSVTGPTTTPT